MHNSFKPIAFISAILLVFISAGCKSSEPKPAIDPRPITVVDPAKAGAVSGVITFDGPQAKPVVLDMSQDPACPQGPQPADSARPGNAAPNIFVYIKEGLGNARFGLPETPPVLNQIGCRYVPHMMGVMAGQTLEIRNDDRAQHNVHPMPRANDEWNESQMPRGKPILKVFRQPEMMMPIQCNQHPWMKSYLNVMDHPYFAVTGEDGRYEIKNLPPGEYTLAAMNEKREEQTVRIKVDAQGSPKADFKFAAGAPPR
jgi:hypothetical protein